MLHLQERLIGTLEHALMKNILLFAACVYLSAGFAQTDSKYPPHKLSHEDSTKVDEYWVKANHVRLGSELRQLYLDSALAIMPWNAYFWQQKAMPLSKAMKHELAAPFLDSAVKYDPGRWLEYRGFINCIFSKQYRAALEDFYGATVLNGNSGVMDHPYYFYEALCHLQLNHVDSARYLLQKCIEERTAKLGADWTHHLHWFYLGITWYEEENKANAIECFDQALKLNPTFPDALFYKAQCLWQMGDKRTALDMMYTTDSLVQKGYSMNEDNNRYETYPYQMRPYALQYATKWLKKELEE